MSDSGSRLADNTIRRLNLLGEQYLNKERHEDALGFFWASAKLQFCYNQQYTDEQIEVKLSEISHKTGRTFEHQKDDDAVLFYDGFGADIRGLAYIYIKALRKIGYRIIYITCADKEEQQPGIIGILRQGKHKIYRVNNNGSKLDKTEELRKIFEEEPFTTAFFYTTPWDVAAVMAFNELQGKCIRYQINLTDHAFWLGKYAFDYCLEFRPYGASVSEYYRKIGKERLILMPYYPIIDRKTPFRGFPFDASGKKVIFSGGSLNKTIDTAGTYYHLVEHIVKKYDDTIFLYAGTGPTEEFERLIAAYPGRIYLIEERNDLLQVLKHSRIYLNTYPISGGLMIQYAAAAKCVPVTLRRDWDEDACGILKDEEALGEIFTDFENVCREIERLIEDDEYWEKKRKLLEGQVQEEWEFENRLEKVLINPAGNIVSDVRKIDTTKFLLTYRENITPRDVAIWVFDKECNLALMSLTFPRIALTRIRNKLLHK